MKAPFRPICGYAWQGQESAPVVPRVITAMWGSSIAGSLKGRISHSSWALDYSCSHCGRVRVGTAQAPWLERPRAVAHLYPPHTIYWQDDDHGTSSESAYITFDGGHAAGLMNIIPEAHCFARIRDAHGLLLAPLKAAATAGTEMGAYGFWTAQAALCEVIQLLHRATPLPGQAELEVTATTHPPTPASPFVQAVDALLADHVGHRLTLSEIARILHVSPSTLSHKYAAEAGKPPLATFAAMRLETARTLIMGGMKLAAVADCTGFCDAYHLSKAFRRHFAVAPANYRHNAHEALSEPLVVPGFPGAR